MNFRWSPQALADLENLFAYIATDSPTAARRVVTTIVTLAEEQLSRFPHSGRHGRVPGTRELVIPRLPYIVPYRVNEADVDILGVYHAARRWPDKL